MSIEDRMETAINLAAERTKYELRAREHRKKEKLFRDIRWYHRAKVERERAEAAEEKAENIRKTLQTMLNNIARTLTGGMTQ